MIKLSEDAIAYLKCYKRNTYGINMPTKVAKELVSAGLVEWLLYIQWSGPIWALTDAGRRYCGMDGK